MNQPQSLLVAVLEGPGAYEYEDVVGESFHRDELHTIINRAHASARDNRAGYGDVVLMKDQDNPFDDNAIAVYFDGLHVGHIARDETDTIHGVIDYCAQQGYNPTQVACKGVIVWSGDQTVMNVPIGVRLDLARTRTDPAV